MMAATIQPPDEETRDRQQAKVERLQHAVDTGDLSELLPDDLVVKLPNEMIACE